MRRLKDFVMCHKEKRELFIAPPNFRKLSSAPIFVSIYIGSKLSDAIYTTNAINSEGALPLDRKSVV